MFEKRCDNCPFIVELRAEIADAEQTKSDYTAKYFEHADENARILTAEVLPDLAVANLISTQQKLGLSVDELIEAYDEVIEVDERGIKYAKALCVTPYVLRQMLLFGKKPKTCTSLLHIISR